MKIEFTGRQTEVPPEVRTLAERKLQKLARVLPGITRWPASCPGSPAPMSR